MPYINQGIVRKDVVKDTVLDSYKPIELEEVNLLEEFVPLLNSAVEQVTDKFLDFSSLFKRKDKETTIIDRDFFTSRMRK